MTDRKLVYARYKRAIRRGELRRPGTCSKCGASGKIHGHHPDYSRPLDVVWLCVNCHWAEHRVIRRETRQREVERTMPGQIADLRSLGWKLDDIGRAFGITKQRVSAILKRIARETKA